MSLRGAVHQKPAQAGRNAERQGEAEPEALRDEARTARYETGSPGRDGLLTQALARANLVMAWKRVKANRGSAGVDGKSIAETAVYLKTHWPRIREALLDGSYRPAPVRRVQIPKPGGGMRELGIPTVTDRLIQQALLQVLQPIIDPTFSDHSYGFRPGRRARDAVLMAQRHVQDGYRVVVDVDLEKFFDRVNHDILMERLSRRVADKAVLRLVRRYLVAGIMDGGMVRERYEGTPQGGPLSPLLANVLLDEVDRELEKRGHRFVRYADDCNVYVRSRRTGERVLAGLRKLYERLHLKVNEAKTAVAQATGRKFLGYALWRGAGDRIKCAVSWKAQATFKQRIRELTGRSGGRSLPEVAEKLKAYMPDWKAYFQLAQTPKVFRELDEWIRHRLRAVQLKHWRRGTTMYRELRALGASEADAGTVAANSRRWWRNSRLLLNRVMPIAYFDRLGVPRLS
ncbi:group II intron reverse transcriptase/maturase [Burkholderia vietnamiensis]|uniref:group II intron reverse transcriptase/maturase n=1 Tax=Burkholderia vietnamiensis TaxID=60552 RepID=UPI00158C7F37|nr:group II intron reverse transcriptase/maturase [Burkholderia vietnamiensis]